MTLGELKAKLEKLDLPDNWVIRIYEEDLPFPVYGFVDIIDFYVEDEGEIGILTEHTGVTIEPSI